MAFEPRMAVLLAGPEEALDRDLRRIRDLEMTTLSCGMEVLSGSAGESNFHKNQGPGVAEHNFQAWGPPAPLPGTNATDPSTPWPAPAFSPAGTTTPGRCKLKPKPR